MVWLDEANPDIVCLQETKCTDEQFPEEALRDAGYAAAFHGQKSYNGVAILAKEEPREVRTGFCDEIEDEQARVIAASVDAVRVISIYAPNGQAVGAPAYAYKLAWYARLTKCLREKEGAIERVVVCGDFNVAPNDDDVHDPALWRGAIMCSEGERKAFEELCDIGFADTLRLQHLADGAMSPLESAGYLLGRTVTPSPHGMKCPSNPRCFMSCAVGSEATRS